MCLWHQGTNSSDVSATDDADTRGTFQGLAEDRPAAWRDPDEAKSRKTSQPAHTVVYPTSPGSSATVGRYHGQALLLVIEGGRGLAALVAT